MTWERLRWVVGAIALVAIVFGIAGWSLLDANCGTGAGSQGQTSAESFDCDSGGYALLAAWGLGSLALTAIVATEFIRRIRDTGDEDSSNGAGPAGPTA